MILFAFLADGNEVVPENFDPYHKWLGIGPEEQPPNHYRLLGVALFEDDPDVLAHAADQRMAHLRTFQNGPHRDVCSVLLNQIAGARVCLLDPRKRETYNRQLRRRVDESIPEPPPLMSASPGRPPTETAACRMRSRRLFRRRLNLALGLGTGILVGLGLAAVAMLRNGSRSENVEHAESPDASMALSQPAKAPVTPQIATPPTSPIGQRESPSERLANSSEPAAEAVEEPGLEDTPTSPEASAPEAAVKPAIVLTPPDRRASVPSEAALAKAFEAVREVYEADYEAARNAEQRQALAVKLLRKADNTRNDLPGRMTLLKLIMQVARQADDRQTLFQAIDELSGTFQVDGLQLKVEALDEFAAKAETEVERDGIIQLAMPLIDQALAVDRFDMADNFARLATISAGSAADTQVADPVCERIRQIERARQAFDRRAAGDLRPGCERSGRGGQPDLG